MLRANVCLLALLALLCTAGATRGADEGQADLDRATELQLNIKSLSDIEQVIALCESALEKGLEGDDVPFAKQLLVGALWQHASQLSAAIFEQGRPHPDWPGLRRRINSDLEKIVQHDPQFADAYLLRARLAVLPRGDRERGLEAINRAIELFADDARKRSEALLQRALLRENDEQELADLDAAIEADPSNSQAWQSRANYHIRRGDLDQAVEDFQELLEKEEDNIAIHQALAEALTALERYELALEHIGKAIELAPESALNYALRSRLHEDQDQLAAAVADLDQALRLEPSHPGMLLSRSRLNYLRDDLKAAREDIDRVLQIQPQAAQGILLRSMISAAERRFGEAIEDLQLLLSQDPQNHDLQLQLASFLMADSRPRKAIAVLSAIIQADEGNWAALRTRADAYLSVGKHAEAVEDYKTAIQLQPEEDGILNNFAWVLATSPRDELRDGQRAIELATKAAEVTDYQQPHILSTLAAAYAETGDFETAIKWSSKAVELGQDKLKDQLEQLEQELESYKKGEPWRELQEVKEKLEPPARVIET